MVLKAPDPDWIRIGIQPKMLELDPDPDEMNADPQPCRPSDSHLGPVSDPDQQTLDTGSVQKFK